MRECLGLGVLAITKPPINKTVKLVFALPQNYKTLDKIH